MNRVSYPTGLIKKFITSFVIYPVVASGACCEFEYSACMRRFMKNYVELFIHYLDPIIVIILLFIYNHAIFFLGSVLF